MSDQPCFVYAICHVVDGELDGPVKIGISASPTSRLRELQTGSPHKLAVAFCALLASRNQALRVERSAHGYAEKWAMSGEWFNVDPSYAVGMISSCIVLEHGAFIAIPEHLIAEGLQ